MSHEHRHTRGFIRGQLATGIETEPAHPEHRGADHHHPGIVRHVQLGGEPVAGSEAFCENKGGNTRSGVHHNAPGKVEDPLLHEPTAAPHPVDHWSVDYNKPKCRKEQHCRKFHTLHKSTHDQSGRDNRKGQLEHDKDRFGDVAAHAAGINPLQAEL